MVYKFANQLANLADLSPSTKTLLSIQLGLNFIASQLSQGIPADPARNSRIELGDLLGELNGLGV